MDGADERRMSKKRSNEVLEEPGRTMEVGCRLTFRTTVCQNRSFSLAALQPSQRESRVQMREAGGVS